MAATGVTLAHAALTKLLLEHKRSGDRWIGLESERFVANEQGSILHFEPYLRQVLRKLVEKHDWGIDYEVDGIILGLKKNFHAISIEPGGQFEISPSPQRSVDDVRRVENDIDRQVRDVFGDPTWRFLGAAFNDGEAVSDIELLPSPRYRLMDRHFVSIKSRGQEMMRKTCGIQVNMDFSVPLEGISMLQAGFRIAPFMAALFANSPSKGRLGERQLIWENTDGARSGFLKGIFDSQFSFDHYIQFLTRMPLMYAFDDNGVVFDPQGKSLADLPEAWISKNILSCSRQIFTHLRLKPCCVEVRFLDQQEEDLRWGATAMTIGLIYDDDNRMEIANLIQSPSIAQLEKTMHEGCLRGLKSDEIYPICIQLLRMAERGLQKRNFGEEKFLKPVEDLIRNAETPAERFSRMAQL